MNQSGNAITPTLAAIWSKGALAIAWFEQIEIQNAYKNGRKKNKRRKKMVGLQQVRSHLPEVLIMLHTPQLSESLTYLLSDTYLSLFANDSV